MLDADTAFETPTLDVEGTGTVVENQPYTLSLTAEYPDGEPGAVDHWLVDWNDGPGGTSDVISYPAGADPTQPLAVTHTFNAGIDSPNVLVTAVDAANGNFPADAQPVAVTPIAPTGLSASASGSSIVVNWTNTSLIATGATILLSTDGTDFFEAGYAAAGAATATLTDLNLDTNYWVEVEYSGANGLSAATAPYSVNTPYVAPTLVITPTDSPVEGQVYSLSLSATYADGTPQIDQIADWKVNWGDGNGTQDYMGQTANASTTYPDSTLSATVQITALDGNGHPLTASQMIYFAPAAVTDVTGSLAAGGASGTISWTGDSSIASEYIVQQLAPGATMWQTVATVAANADGNSHTYSLPIGSLTPSANGGDGGYLFQVGAKSADSTSDAAGTPGVSAFSMPSSLTDDDNSNEDSPLQSWSPPLNSVMSSGATETLTVTNIPAHVSYELDLQGWVGDGDSSNDVITLDGPGGLEAQETAPFTQNTISLNMIVPDLDGGSTATFTVKGVTPGNDSQGHSRTWGLGVTPFLVYTGNISPTGGGVDVGGESSFPVNYSGQGLAGYNSVTLTVKNYDPSKIDPVSSTVTVYNNHTGTGDYGSFSGTMMVKGVGAGNSPLVLQDPIGDQASTTINSQSPSVAAVGTVVEGTTYDQSHTPGFSFTLPDVSQTAVTVHFNTNGSTLPGSLMGPLSSGTVSIPAGDTSLFVPFTPNDGLVSADRWAVVTLEVPGEVPASQVVMHVEDQNQPIVKMNGAVDKAVIQLDPQGDSSKLTTISLDANVSTANGQTITSSSLEWNYDEFTMWPADVVGIAGTDLGSDTHHRVYTIPGTDYDIYTWPGSPPEEIYGQSLLGSSDWDTTKITFAVDTAIPATALVGASTGGFSNNSHGTANGPELMWNNKVVNGVTAGDMLIGQGVGLSVQWAGPMPNSDASDNVSNWTAYDGVGGYDTTGNVGVVIPLNPVSFTNSIHFYWGPVSGNGNSKSEAVSVSGDIDGNSFSLDTNFNVWTPSWSLNRNGPIGTATNDGNDLIQLLADNTGQPFGTIATINGVKYTCGVRYKGTVTDGGSMPISLAGGQWSFTQLATPGATIRIPGKGAYSMFQTGVEGLDTANPASFDDQVPVYAPVGPASHEFGDSPGLPLPDIITKLLKLTPLANSTCSCNESFRTFLMFTPPGGDSINVPLAVAQWWWKFVAQSSGNPVIWKVIDGSSKQYADPSGKPTSAFPEWNYVVNGDDWRKGA